jgi:nitrogen fixation NifU-like protein
LTLSLKMNGDRVEDVRFEGKGCAISTASASMMTEAIKGKDRATIGELFNRVHTLLTRQDAVPSPELGKLAALSGVREFPARVKCASLCWHTLNAALEQSDATISTE